VTISEGQTTNSSGTYTGQVGTLQVTISPQGRLMRGEVEGRRRGMAGQRVYADVSVGTHTVGFSEVDGLTTRYEEVVISGGQAGTATGRIRADWHVAVTISPQGAIDAGAKWRVVGGVWHGSGDTQTVSVGPHTVEFSDIAGWRKPGTGR